MSGQPEPTSPEMKNVIDHVVEELCRPESYDPVLHKPALETAMPSVDLLNEIVERLRAIFFPGYFRETELTPVIMPYYIGSSLDRVQRLLCEQIKRGFCFSCKDKNRQRCVDCEVKSSELVNQFMLTLPKIRKLLTTDVVAAYEGDPAAKTPEEAIFCYPSIKALTNHRIAHELYRLEVANIPRIISEMAHSQTGIDIHPGATIGERFFIDHGTGTVIGETCLIGNNVRLYHGVTLGAKSFPKDKNGTLVKGIPRHPIVEDDVIIYSGTTVLGRVRIGKGSVIGGNVWLTHDVEPGTRVIQDQGQPRILKG